jgi:hypothetical protein
MLESAAAPVPILQEQAVATGVTAPNAAEAPAINVASPEAPKANMVLNLERDIPVAGSIIMSQMQEKAVQDLVAAEDPGTYLADQKNAALVMSRNLRLLNQETVAKYDGKVDLPVNTQVSYIDKNGYPWQIVSVTGVDGDNFTVKAVDKNNPIPQNLKEPVSRQDLILAMLKQKIVPVIDQFPEAQRKLIKTFIEGVDGTAVFDQMGAPEQTALKEALSDAGILTVEDIETFVKKQRPILEAPKDATDNEVNMVSIHNEGQRKQIDNLMAPLLEKGYIVTDYTAVAEIFNQLGVNTAAFQGQAIEAGKQNKTLTDLLNKKLGEEIVMDVDGKPTKVKIDKAMRSKWEEKQKEQQTLETFFKEIAVQMEKENPLKSYFEAVSNGTLDQEVGQQVVNSFKTGEIGKTPDVSKERNAKVSEAMKELQRGRDVISLLKKGGYAISALAALSAFFAFRASKEQGGGQQ